MELVRRCGTAIDYGAFLTRRSRARQPSPIRAIVDASLKQPDLISLGGGMPNPRTFPFSRVTAELNDGSGASVDLSGADLHAALQYSPTAGLPPLVAHLTRLQQSAHGTRPDEEICVTTGSADAVAKAFDMLIEAGDAVLVETPTYSGSLAYLQPMGSACSGSLFAACAAALPPTRIATRAPPAQVQARGRSYGRLRAQPARPGVHPARLGRGPRGRLASSRAVHHPFGLQPDECLARHFAQATAIRACAGVRPAHS